MAQLIEYVDELVQEIGPRPAGTQQEHQAAELIAARLDGFGMLVDIEEFPCARNLGWVRVLYYALCVIGSVLSIFDQSRIVGALLIIVGAVLMTLDHIGNNPLFNLFTNSLSQNVVARYSPPGSEESSHIRKVVVLAHYDSPRTTVQAAPSLISHYTLLRRVVRITMLLLVLLALLLLIPFPAIVKYILTVITVIVAVVVLVALLAEIINFFMPYNLGVNCNGSSLGVLYGLAQVLSSGIDVASFRDVSGQTKKRQIAFEETNKRPARGSRGGNGSADIFGGAGTAGSAAASSEGFMGRLQNLVKKRDTQRGSKDEIGSTPTDQGGFGTTDSIMSKDQTSPSMREKQQDLSLAAQAKRERTVTSVGDNLANPFITQRPPLAEIEEANRLQEEEREKRLEERRRLMQDTMGETPGSVPAWYAKAKKNAALKTESRQGETESEGIVRSRFANVPTTGRAAGSQRQAEMTPVATPVTATPSVIPTETSDMMLSPAPGSVQITFSSEAMPDVTPTTSMDTPVSTEPVESYRATPITAKPDFSGLDKEAFRVLPSRENDGVKVIVPAQASPAIVQTDPAPENNLRNRLQGLPSLSVGNTGGIPVQQATLDEAPIAKEDLFSSDNSLVSANGSFVPLGTTGIMKPLGEELLNYHDQSEIYVVDADDTSITEHYSKTGEYSEPELVNIPESRMKSFLSTVGDRFSGKKREKLNDSPAAWLNVDNAYDARKEGRGIGSWDNFGEDDEEWKGGAYGGKDYKTNASAIMNLSNELLDKEIWLVALGANESKNAGLKCLLANHGNELKSALFINLVGIGTGDLVYTVSEGSYRPAQTDPRMQSLIASAAQNMAIPIGPVDFTGFATDATVALKEGARAISLMGLGRGMPVGWRWSDDEISRLREDNLLDAVALVIETIKNI